MAPRWKKALADVLVRPGRSVLAVLAVAIGVAAIGTLAFKQAILRPVLSNMHLGTNPASATFFVDSLDEGLLDLVRAVPGVGEVEARPLIMARLRVGNPGDEILVPAMLYVVDDFDDQRINTFLRDAGAWPPGAGEVLLERTAVTVAKAARGDSLWLKLAGGAERPLRFTGTVYAAGFAPAWMEHVVYGFIPRDSRARLDGSRESLQLLMRVAEHPLEEGHVREVADRVRGAIEGAGYGVRRVNVPTPGLHPHTDQMNTFLYLVGAFAVLAFLLSAVLAAGMIHAIQAEQVKQVGIMKAIGARSGQIAGVYLAHVGFLVVMALCIGLPAGWYAGRAYAQMSANVLNADVSQAPFPVATLFVVVAVSVVVPMVAALVPVWRASRITVREALADTGVGPSLGGGRVERMLTAAHWIPRPLALVLRDTVARRGRVALTVGMLAVGGAMFMSALNVSAGWERAANEDFERRRFDLILWLADSHPVERIDGILSGVPGFARAEYWPTAAPYLIGADGAAGKPVGLLGVPPDSRLIEPNIVSGSWLGNRSDGAVINQGIRSMHSSLAVGDTVSVRYEGRTLSFPVVGIVKELLPQPLIYAPEPAVLSATGLTGNMTRTVRIVTHEHGDEAQRAAARGIERAFEEASVEVARVMRMEDMKGAVLDHLVIIQLILALAAGVVVLVGSMGLTSTLSIHVVQRTREIGVMGAIGASPRTLAGFVWCEGLLLSMLSLGVAVALSLPASYVLESVTGRMFFRAPLDFTVSPQGIGIWLLMLLVLATLSSVQPAFRAARLTVREAITHA